MKRYIIIIFGIVIAAVLILFGMGRSFFGAAGGFLFWSGDIMSNTNSQALFDPYTFTHIIHGLGFYLLLWIFGKKMSVGKRFVIALCLEAGWEIFENTSFVIERYREATLSLEYYGDSILNVIGDIMAMIAGFVFAARMPRWASIVFFIVLEAALIWWIRDSLILNIIMLIYPVPAIKEWQLAL